MWGMSIAHWVVVIGVVVLLFGRGRISGLMADIGGGLKEFKKATKELLDDEKDPVKTDLSQVDKFLSGTKKPGE